MTPLSTLTFCRTRFSNILTSRNKAGFRYIRVLNDLKFELISHENTFWAAKLQSTERYLVLTRAEWTVSHQGLSDRVTELQAA
jgi:hypothetical protein